MKINFYDKWFFTIYCILTKLGQYDLGFKTAALFSFLLSFNFIAVFLLFFNKSHLELSLFYWGIVAFSFIILITNEIYFLRNKRYKNIYHQLNQGKDNYVVYGVIYLISTLIFVLAVIIE